MRQEKVFRGTNSTHEFRPEKKMMVKPKIKREFFMGNGENKVRMYETENGPDYLADVFDKVFNQEVKLTVKPKNFKAKSIDPTVIY